MQRLNGRIGWSMAGLAMGLGLSALLGAAIQDADQDETRYQVGAEVTFGAVVITAHDKRANTMHLYIAGNEDPGEEGKATIPRVATIQLDGLGGDVLDATIYPDPADND